MAERLADLVERSAAQESTHQRNYRLMREHRDAAERVFETMDDLLTQRAPIAVCAALAQVHATLALFYQREVRQ